MRKRRFTDKQLQERKYEYTRQWRIKNKQKLIDYRRKYYLKNREKLTANRLKKYPAYYAKYGEKIKAKIRQYRIDNPLKVRNANLKTKYGLSLTERQLLIEKQLYQCAACETNLKELPPHEIQIDHCHTSGTIRAILCGPCNRALGLLGDNPIRVQKLADYARNAIKEIAKSPTLNRA